MADRGEVVFGSGLDPTSDVPIEEQANDSGIPISRHGDYLVLSGDSLTFVAGLFLSAFVWIGDLSRAASCVPNGAGADFQ